MKKGIKKIDTFVVFVIPNKKIKEISPESVAEIDSNCNNMKLDKTNFRSFYADYKKVNKECIKEKMNDFLVYLRAGNIQSRKIFKVLPIEEVKTAEYKEKLNKFFNNINFND